MAMADVALQRLAKKGNKSFEENYRLVTLTSHCSKLMESIIRDALMEYIEINQLLNNSQHGFRVGRSASCLMLVLLWCGVRKQSVEVEYKL